MPILIPQPTDSCNDEEALRAVHLDSHPGAANRLDLEDALAHAVSLGS